MLRRVVLAFLAVSTVGLAMGNRISSFAQLPRGDMLVIKVTSLGCYGGSGYEFVYSPAGNGSFEVQELELQFDQDHHQYYANSRAFLGKITLEPGEAAKLDATMEYYRHNHAGSCTTTSILDCMQMRGSVVVAEEVLVDDTCADLSGYLTLPHLGWLLSHNHENERAQK